MKITILTIFPELFKNFIETSLIARAIKSHNITIECVNIRDFATDRQKMVDDEPYGGGVGMLMKFPPIYDAVVSLKKENSKVILLSPQGKLYKQKIAKKLSKEEHLIFICGRYEGVDERVKQIIDAEISIGDYVLLGGEIPAMAIVESVVRLIPGVINNASVSEDSLENNLLKYPEYTRPAEYKGYKVPDVLLSGNHQEIYKWRMQKQIENTKIKRKDLIKK